MLMRSAVQVCICAWRCDKCMWDMCEALSVYLWGAMRAGDGDEEGCAAEAGGGGTGQAGL